MSELSLARVLIEIQMMYLGMPDRRGLLTFWAELQCANGQGLDRPAFEAGLQRVVSENANEVPRRWTSESRTPAAGSLSNSACHRERRPAPRATNPAL